VPEKCSLPASVQSENNSFSSQWLYTSWMLMESFVGSNSGDIQSHFLILVNFSDTQQHFATQQNTHPFIQVYFINDNKYQKFRQVFTLPNNYKTLLAQVVFNRSFSEARGKWPALVRW
jgi:hypothetical protein